MKTLQQILTFSLATLLAPLAPAAVTNFHFGALKQTGGAALGGAGDIWNASNLTNGTNVPLVDSTGAASGMSLSWTSGEAGQATTSIWSSVPGTPMDTATAPLMTGYAQSYAASPTTITHLSATISGLQHGKTYTLALYGAGDMIGHGTYFTITGASTTWIHTLAINRMLSGGATNAYGTATFTASSAGTVTITTKTNGTLPHAVMNGLQIALGNVTPNNLVPVTTPAKIAVWGVNGHPGTLDYASYISANAVTQIHDVQTLGAGYYRVTFNNCPLTYLDDIAPQAKAAGISLLPVLPVKFIAANSAQTNYNNNYAIAYNWASYAITQGYPITYWELGNEPENANNVSVIGDGAAPAQFVDKTPGGFVAIASGLEGAYDGVKQAYADGRAAGKTTITPLCLAGMCFHHWGLLAKIQAYDGELPCDIISWHWYGPLYGDFSLPTNALGQPDDGRIPAVCLADFKSKTDPTKPMDVWITETDRSQSVNGVLLNGSAASLTAPKTNQTWAAQATAIQGNCDSFKKCANVKAVFVYELYDETIAYNAATAQVLANEGYFGLITGLNGTKKNAYTTYQNEIKSAK